MVIIENGILDTEEKLSVYKQIQIAELSIRSNQARQKILSDQKILNILTGATDGYPEYLTAGNVALMIERFKTVAEAGKAAINSATDKESIDAALEAVVFPTAAEILKEIAG